MRGHRWKILHHGLMHKTAAARPVIFGAWFRKHRDVGDAMFAGPALCEFIKIQVSAHAAAPI